MVKNSLNIPDKDCALARLQEHQTGINKHCSIPPAMSTISNHVILHAAVFYKSIDAYDVDPSSTRAKQRGQLINFEISESQTWPLSGQQSYVDKSEFLQVNTRCMHACVCRMRQLLTTMTFRRSHRGGATYRDEISRVLPHTRREVIEDNV